MQVAICSSHTLGSSGVQKMQEPMYIQYRCKKHNQVLNNSEANSNFSQLVIAVMALFTFDFLLSEASWTVNTKRHFDVQCFSRLGTVSLVSHIYTYLHNSTHIYTATTRHGLHGNDGQSIWHPWRGSSSGIEAYRGSCESSLSDRASQFSVSL